MILEKLQMIATTPIESTFKVKWLKWWNFNGMSQESLCFPLDDIKEKELEKWLFKAPFQAQVRACPSICLILFYSCPQIR